MFYFIQKSYKAFDVFPRESHLIFGPKSYSCTPISYNSYHTWFKKSFFTNFKTQIHPESKKIPH